MRSLMASSDQAAPRGIRGPVDGAFQGETTWKQIHPSHSRRRQRRSTSAHQRPSLPILERRRHELRLVRTGDLQPFQRKRIFRDGMRRQGFPVLALVRRLLFPLSDRGAKAARMRAIECLPGTVEQAIPGGIIHHHPRPCHHLHHPPMAAAEMQTADHGDDDADETVQGGSVLQRSFLRAQTDSADATIHHITKTHLVHRFKRSLNPTDATKPVDPTRGAARSPDRSNLSSPVRQVNAPVSSSPPPLP